MTVTVYGPTVPVGTTLDEARSFLHQHKVEKLLVVDKDFRLKGLITVKDIQKGIKYPNACKDALGRLRCGAAIGTSKDSLERAHALVESGMLAHRFVATADDALDRVDAEIRHGYHRATHTGSQADAVRRRISSTAPAALAC